MTSTESDFDSDNGPCARFHHDHPPVRNTHEEHQTQLTRGQRVADRVAAVVGSWPFIIVQSVLLFVWMSVNAYLAITVARNPQTLKAWDPYPFILLNLVLSFQAAYTGPVVMMSQNRQSERDRLLALHDYEINQKAETEVGVIMEHLVYQDRMLRELIGRVDSIQKPGGAHGA